MNIMEYLKSFSSHTDYEEYLTGGTMVKPNVSYCEDVKEVHYNPIPHDYSQDYLTTVALGGGTISFNIPKAIDTEYITSISYSTDDGNTWTTTNNTDGRTESIIVTVNVNRGDSILWKGEASSLADVTDSSTFSSTTDFNIEGNIMSLAYGDDFKDKTELTEAGIFIGLFNGSRVVEAENLSLPATKLSTYCYTSMFASCASLVSAPKLIATELGIMCYAIMFSGCTSLTTAPELPATALEAGCYMMMFADCTSLTSAPELPATTLTQQCYSYMFQGCTSLENAPQLSATTLAQSCYEYMFSGCTNLNYIKAMFTTTPSTTYTQNWVNGVATNGTFVKNSAATWNPEEVRGVNGVPTNWTVQTASE